MYVVCLRPMWVVPNPSYIWQRVLFVKCIHLNRLLCRTAAQFSLVPCKSKVSFVVICNSSVNRSSMGKLVCDPHIWFSQGFMPDVLPDAAHSIILLYLCTGIEGALVHAPSVVGFAIKIYITNIIKFKERAHWSLSHDIYLHIQHWCSVSTSG